MSTVYVYIYIYIYISGSPYTTARDLGKRPEQWTGAREVVDLRALVLGGVGGVRVWGLRASEDLNPKPQGLGLYGFMALGVGGLRL